jgi:hypothetical protein
MSYPAGSVKVWLSRGRAALITYCGFYLDNDGKITKLTKLPGGLITAALTG